MIWHSHKCVFIHIPKTSGSSVEIMFRENGAKYNVKMKHRYASYHAKHHKGAWANFYKFTVVRNPWDRIYSLWFNYKKEGRVKADFHHWLKSLSTNGNSFSKPQVRWIYSNGKNELDYIGRFEEMEKNFDFLIDRFKLDVEIPPHIHNIDGKPSYRDHYEDKTIDLVAKLFEEDIKEFGYNFEGMSK